MKNRIRHIAYISLLGVALVSPGAMRAADYGFEYVWQGIRIDSDVAPVASEDMDYATNYGYDLSGGVCNNVATNAELPLTEPYWCTYQQRMVLTNTGGGGVTFTCMPSSNHGGCVGGNPTFTVYPAGGLAKIFDEEPTRIESPTSDPIAANDCPQSISSIFNVCMLYESEPTAKPDLVSSNATPSVASRNIAATLAGAVSNSGAAPTGAGFANRFEIDNNADHSTITGTAAATSVASSMAVAASQNVTGSYTFTTNGTWYVRLCADSGDVIDEGDDEGNNCSNAWTAVTVSEPKPDLDPGAITPTAPVYAATTTLSATIANIGTAGTGASFSARFQTATDAYGTNATYIGSVISVQNITASSSRVVTISRAFTAPTYMRVIADTSGEISELSEANNYGEWTLIDTGAPDLTPTALSPDIVLAGANTTFTGSILNQGTRAATTFTSNVAICAETDTACMAGSISRAKSPWERFTAFFVEVAHAASPINFTLSGASNLAIGETGSQTGTRQFTTPGRYMLQLCADRPADSQVEMSDSNNCDDWELLVVCPSTNVIESGACVVPTLSCEYDYTDTDGNDRISTGEMVTFDATPSNRPSYTWDPSDGGILSDTDAHASRSYATAGNYSMEVSAIGYEDDTCTFMVYPAGCEGEECTCIAQSLTLSATPSRVERGDTATLSYEIPGVDGLVGECTLSSDKDAAYGDDDPIEIGSCSVETEGTRETHAIQTQTTFTLTCGSETADTIVEVVPDIIER